MTTLRFMALLTTASLLACFMQKDDERQARVVELLALLVEPDAEARISWVDPLKGVQSRVVTAVLQEALRDFTVTSPASEGWEDASRVARSE